jgi:3-oxoacyl-[acyl-carrier protein] reductase
MALLDNKIAFITGGSRGIGAAMLKRFAEEGAAVGFSYVANTFAAEQAQEAAAIYGHKITAYVCDGTQPQAVEETMAAFVDSFGGIDILVNNAGIIKDNLLLDMPFEDWQNVLSANLTAAYLFSQSALKTMIPARKGLIINVSSVSGMHGNAGQANYSASKAGLIGLTKSIAKEVGSRNIRCNAITPGFIETDMTRAIMASGMDDKIRKSIPLKKLGNADDVANLAVFLASDLAAYITGQVISVCGGLSI